MKQDDNYTDVIFRTLKSNPEVIAIMPGIAGTRDPFTCMSYLHVGQHGSLHARAIAGTRLATPSEYGPLLRELESIGYRVRVVKRCTSNHFAQRRQQVKS